MCLSKPLCLARRPSATFLGITWSLDSSSPNGLNKILAAHRQCILEIVYSFFSRNQNDDSMMKPKWWSHNFFTSKPLWSFLWWFLVQMRMEKESSPKSVEIWFHFIIWCHPKMVTPGAGPPSLRHLCCTTGTYIITVPLVSTTLSKTKLCFAEGRDSRV